MCVFLGGGEGGCSWLSNHLCFCCKSDIICNSGWRRWCTEVMRFRWPGAAWTVRGCEVPQTGDLEAVCDRGREHRSQGLTRFHTLSLQAVF